MPTRAATNMEPTTPSHSLYGAVSGIPNSGCSRIAPPPLRSLLCASPVPDHPLVAEEGGDNLGGSPQSAEKSLGVAFRPQGERVGSHFSPTGASSLIYIKQR